MNLNRREFVASLGVGTLLGGWMPAMAANYPSQVVKLIVPFAPGGSVDPAARVMAEALSRVAGNKFIVENRGGAGGVIGADAVVKAEPDGYTLLATSNSMTVSQATTPKVPWDARKDFSYIANFGSIPLVVLVNLKKVPARTLPELVSLAASRPDGLNYGSAGIGSAAHLVGEMLSDHANLKLKHVPYRGAGPASTDLLGGVLDVFVGGLPAAIPLTSSPDIQPIVVTTQARAVQMPQVPTVSETHPGFDFSTWLGVGGPAKLPPSVRDQVAGWVKEVVADPAVNKRLIEIGVTPEVSESDKVMELVNRDLDALSEVARRRNIRTE